MIVGSSKARAQYRNDARICDIAAAIKEAGIKSALARQLIQSCKTKKRGDIRYGDLKL